MTRKYLRERQARRLEEGQQDAANRCTFCKRALKPGHLVMNLIGPASTANLNYCDTECRLDHEEVLNRVIEARR